MIKKLKKLAYTGLNYLLIISFILGSCSSFGIFEDTVYADEAFYVDFMVDDLAYRQQYDSVILAIKQGAFPEQASMVDGMGVVAEFMKHMTKSDEDERYYNAVIDQLNTEAAPNGVLKHFETGAVYDFSYLYGVADLWESFSAADREGKVRYKDNYGVRPSTNAEMFGNVYHPYAKTAPVILLIAEQGVAYTVNGGDPTMACNPV